jgi:c-di-GMP-binding flagellar brake protein YcgR
VATPLPEEIVQAESRFLNTVKDIEQCFKTVRDECIPLTLTIDGTATRVTAKVLDVIKRGILVEDIRPREALSILRGRPKCSISIRANGSFIFAQEACISGEGEDQGLPYFHIPFPKEMVFQQRRRAARLKLPSRVSSAGAHITLFGKEDYVGQIIDISAGGCRAVFPADAAAHLAPGVTIDQSAIYLTPRLELHSESVIRHCRTQQDGTIVAGIELTQMQITDRRRLEKFIQSLKKKTRDG